MTEKMHYSEEGMEASLWAFIDGLDEERERAATQKLIEDNAAWRAKYQELLAVHQALNLSELEEPSMRFTRNVMEEIAKYQIAPATKSYINNKIIYGIGIFFLTVIAGFLIYGIGQIDWTVAGDNNATFGIDLGKVDYSRMFSNNFVNIFMGLNIVLGLMLLDRYLDNRKKHYMKQA